MMQQVATQRADIATLPVDAANTAKEQDKSKSGNDFSALFRESSSDSHSGAKNGDTVTDAKQRNVHNKTAVEDRNIASDRADSETSKDRTSGTDLPEKRTVTQSEKETREQPPANEAGDDEPDWLAYVDAIRNLADNDKQGSSEEVLNELSELLEKAGAGESKESAESLSLEELAGALVEAMNEMLSGEDEEAENVQPSQGVAEEEIQKLAAAFISLLTKNGREINAKSDADNTNTDTTSAQNGKMDASILIAMVKAELGSDQQQQGESGGQQEQHDSTKSSETLLKRSDDFMQTLKELSPQGREVATDALADKVVSLLPEGVTENQKQALKQNIVGAVNELQNKLKEGEVSQASLEGLINNAIAEAGIDTSAGLERAIASEVRQMSLLAGAALQVTQPTPVSAAHASSTPDIGVQDLQQIKAERSQSAIHANEDKPVNIHQPEGQQQLAEKVRWMVNARNPMAEIRLDPPELGSMQVRVNVSGDTASVNFVVQTAHARDALAQAEPRLREMLAEQGISLGESFVSQQQNGNSGSGDGNGAGGKGAGGQLAENDDEEVIISEQSLSRQALGGIDDYA